MSDRLPYEEQLAQQWNDLPLPDESMAWADMKRRLDEDDDNGIIPVWLRGCGLWGSLALILLALGWWIVRPDKWWNKKETTEKTESINQKKEKDNTNDKKILSPDDTIQVINKMSKKNPDVDKNNKLVDTSVTNVSKQPSQKQKNISQKDDSNISVQVTDVPSTGNRRKNISRSKKSSVGKNKPADTKTARQKTDNKIAGKGNDIVDVSVQPGVTGKKTNDNVVSPVNKPAETGKDSLTSQVTNTNKPDSVKKASTDSAQKKIPEQIAKKDNEPKKDSSKKSKIWFSAGAGMQQLVPVGGQKLTPYSSSGRKGSLADYIPSAYFRVHKDEKWFLQAEFKYGAPQYNKELLYENNLKIETIALDTTKTFTASKLKKTFYHQVPLTLNYFITPNWSVGTGIIWNKFVNAVSVRDQTKQLNSGPIDTLFFGDIVQDKNTSVFAKSYLHAVFETQYRWRKFSFGARYSFGLQPYIKFTLDNGTQQEERNRALNIFVRYEIWRSKKK